jgi:hypothetical protein
MANFGVWLRSCRVYTAKTPDQIQIGSRSNPRILMGAKDTQIDPMHIDVGSILCVPFTRTFFTWSGCDLMWSGFFCAGPNEKACIRLSDITFDATTINHQRVLRLVCCALYRRISTGIRILQWWMHYNYMYFDLISRSQFYSFYSPRLECCNTSAYWRYSWKRIV